MKSVKMKKMGGGNLDAFTLVELLVVIAIIGILIALLLPAVQAAREAARRMQCSNHVKQWLLGLHNHHSAMNTMPAATNRLQSGNNGTDNWSATILLYPYMEQQAFYDVKLSDLSNYGGPQVWDDGWGSMQGQVSSLLCPTSPRASGKNAEQQGSTKTNYMHSYGDAIRPNTFSPTNRGGDARWAAINTRGIFSPNNLRNFSFVTDGLSNTVAIGEAVSAQSFGEDYLHNNIRETFIVLTVMDGGSGIYEGFAGGSGDKGPGEFCSIALVTEPGNRNIYREDSQRRSGHGLRAADGRYPQTGFSTVLPPNSPSCLSWAGDDNWGISSLGSYHPGGVNVGFADGSCQFVSNTIDCGNSTDLPTVSGQSRYGVWGAIGTPQGGESRSL